MKDQNTPAQRNVHGSLPAFRKRRTMLRAATLAERRRIVMSPLTHPVFDLDRKQLVAITPKPVFAPFFRHQADLRERISGVFEFVSGL